MIQVRRAEERGHANHGWLDSFHTFSFGNYYDPEFSGFRDLLVINEDRVVPGAGFGTHGHRDMEIVSYVLEGSLSHKDSLGTGSSLKPGFLQRMSAGTGVRHSEFNGSETMPLHFLQIWIKPQVQSIAPAYEERYFSDVEKNNKLKLVVSPDGRQESMHINQNVLIYASILDADDELEASLPLGRFGWIQVARGVMELNGILMQAGDGAAISEEQVLKFVAKTTSEFLLFDLS